MQEFDDLIKKLSIPLGISLLAGLARFLLSEKKSLWSFCRGVTIAGFVGLMTGMGLQDTALSEGTKGMIIGITAFCADEVALFLIAAASEIRKDPLGYAAKAIESLRRKP